MEETKKKKKSFWKILLIVIILLIVAAMVILPFLLDKAKNATKSTASILNGTVERGTLEKTLSGAGTITDEDAVEVTVPDGVELTEYLVQEGQYVTEGTDLARVDKTSVLQLISTLQTNLAYVEEQMVDAEDTASTGKIVAKTGGKVMKIYAGVGDNVRDVMDKYGCLAVLSIDGYLAADVKAGADIRPGDSVTVEFEDGKTANGKVETKFKGVATVIVSDNYGAPEQTVKISDRQGGFIDGGTLYIHKEWRAVGYSGVINAVSVKEGRKLGTGGTIFTLKNTDTNAQYNLLAGEHRDYEEVIARLFTLYKDGTVKAENDGCATGIDDSLVEDVAYLGQEYEIEYLAFYEDIGTEPTPTPTPALTPSITIKYYVVDSPEDGYVRWYADTITIPDSDPDYGTFISGDQAGVLSKYIPGSSLGGQKGRTVPSGAKMGDICANVTVITSSDSGLISNNYDVIVQNNPSYTPPQEQKIPGGMGGFGGMTQYIYINGQEVEFQKYEINPVTLMNVVPQQKVSVTITVDELDILSVSLGQEATVTVDALPGRSFSGEVVEIDSTGSNSGGNTKFTAKILLDRQANMIAGMNASCTIVTDTYDDVLTVPTEALSEEGNRTVIYTGLDEDGETLINPVEVKTGVSDGIRTQILSGLSEGQEFVYAYYDTLAIADQLAQIMGGGQPPEGFPEGFPERDRG